MNAIRGVYRSLQFLEKHFIEALVIFLGRPALLSALCAVVLIGMLVHGVNADIDADMFVNSDTLYPVQIQHYDWLAYRPPPSNNLFPDVIVHSLLGPWLVDPLTQKISAGAVIFVVTCILLGAAYGLAGVLALLLPYAFSGFYFLDTTAHFSLPLCLLAWLLIPFKPVRNAILFLAVFSDLLFLIPYLVVRIGGVGCLYAEKRECESTWSEWILIVVAIVLSIVYAEYSSGAFKLIPLCVAFSIGLAISRHLGVSHVLCLTIAIVLMLAIPLGLPARYASPVAACLLILLVAQRGPVLHGGFALAGLLISAVALTLAALTIKTDDLRLEKSRYDCLAREIQSRKIDNVAVDHWTAKPLYFAWKNLSERPLIISQMDFELVVPHVWMAPHESFGRQTRWSVHNRNACSRYTSETKFCGQKMLSGVVSDVPLCEIFELVNYENPIPRNPMTAPSGKLGFGWFHIKRYMGKIRALLGD